MITENLFSADHITAKSSQLEQLQKLFPHCFSKSGEFLIDKFQSEIVEQTDISREFYAMNWLGKSYAKLLRNLPPETLLAEDVEHNSKPENQYSQNLLIQGDNLEVLKHLKNAYRNKIKMIYIDPPYNTGSDGFVYQDNRKFTSNELASLAGISSEEAERILAFTDKGSNSHSAWLTFMYPRLYIARELLKEDGVIFISIDDNEAAQLKLLCDEVFGSINYYGTATWTATTKAMNAGSAKYKLQKSDEYIFIYGKVSMQEHPPFNLEVKEEKNYPFTSEDGYKYREEEIQQRKNTGIKKSDKMVFPILGCYPREGNRWTIGSSTAKELEKSGDVLLRNQTIFRKIYKKDENNESHYPLWIDMSDTVGTSENGKAVVLELLQKEHGFETIKPLDLIEKLIFHCTDKNDLVLDFFAGSGTTAHALMNLNLKDNGNRKFICVQLAEITKNNSDAYLAGYKNVFEITKDRIEKASAKIRQDFPNTSGDFSFKIFKTTENFKEHLNDDLSPAQEELFAQTHLNDDELHTLLTTWRLYDGDALTNAVKQVDLGGYIAYWANRSLYLLHSGLASSQIAVLIGLLDDENAVDFDRIVLFGDNIESSKQRELSENLANYQNRLSAKVDLVVRY